MPKFRFNKLVRDKLPEIYNNLNQTIISRRIAGRELLEKLQNKLVEESAEIPVRSGDRSEIISELSDVRQVMFDMQSQLDITDDDIEVARLKKFDKKGGFSDGVYVEAITLTDDDPWVEYYRNQPEKYEEIGRATSAADAKDSIDLPELEKGTYRHNKKGHLYEVLGVALETETDEALVIYRPLYDNKYEIFAQPYSMFTEVVELNGEVKPRFERVDN